MPQTILETPCYAFTVYYFPQSEKHANLTHRPSKRGVMLTSQETECFMSDFNNWHEAMTPEYLAGMLWEAHAMPILNQIDGKE